MKKYSIAVASLIGIASLAVALGVSAQVGLGVGTNATVNVGVGSAVSASTTVRARVEARMENREGSTTAGMRAGMMASTSRMTPQQRMTDMQGRSDTEITARIASLNALLSRINSMTKISATEKASLAASLQAEIADMTTLKGTIDADTSTTSLKTDAQSITKSYRIYALIMPQASIMAAADRVLDLAGELNTVGTKIQAYITTAQSSGTNVSAAVTAMTDLTAKTADATTQANAAVTETASLQPDQGNTTVAAANAAALKDAQSKIKAATADLVAARKDAGTAVNAIKGTMKVSATASASTTTQ
jgi:hypothetical protein